MKKREVKYKKWKKCPICGREFFAKKDCKTRNQIYCSRKCYGLSIAKYKKCLNCGKIFYNYANKYFCSMKCAGEYKRGKKLSEKHIKALSEAKKGKYIFEKHPRWKGDKVGYGALHEWVRKVLGNPIKCSICGKKGNKNGRNWSIHWANKSGEYKRNINDWIALCVKCHKKYDLERKFTGQKAKKL
jgi:hypothetical protein